MPNSLLATVLLGHRSRTRANAYTNCVSGSTLFCTAYQQHRRTDVCKYIHTYIWEEWERTGSVPHRHLIHVKFAPQPSDAFACNTRIYFKSSIPFVSACTHIHVQHEIRNTFRLWAISPTPFLQAESEARNTQIPHRRQARNAWLWSENPSVLKKAM